VGQLRKYTGDPYIVHPAEVASQVAAWGGTDEQIAAAWLHDVVEDTGVSIDTVRAEFGDAVADLVAWLTDVSQLSDGNRAVRKAIDRQHAAAAPAEAQLIKCADICSNTVSIAEHDAKFAEVYLREICLLVDVLFRADASVVRHTRFVIRQAKAKLAADQPAL
jgi:(p)ppGpp synthase/HD superfamily hydrolase